MTVDGRLSQKQVFNVIDTIHQLCTLNIDVFHWQQKETINKQGLQQRVLELFLKKDKLEFDIEEKSPQSA